MDKTKEKLNRVKEKVDFIYSITNGIEYKDGFKVLGDRFLEECVTALVRRNILQKTRYYIKGELGVHYIFTWVAAMAPTDTLYINIYKDILQAHRVKQERWKLAKRAQRNREKQVEENLILEKSNIDTSDIIPIKQEQEYKQLCDYTPQELWDELRARGYQIDEGKIVLIQKTYLD